MVEILFYAGLPLACAALFIVAIWAFQRPQRRRQWLQSAQLVRYRGPLLVALCCLLLGLVIAVRYADNLARANRDEAQQRFLHEAEQLEDSLQGQMLDLTHELNGLRGLFLASEHVSRTEIKKFIDSRDLRLEYPGYRGLGYIERVPRTGLAAYLAQARRDVGPDYQLWTAGSQPDLFLIKYLEPMGRNANALGYDVGSDPRRRAAAEAAMRGGTAALTPRILLVQDPLARSGFLLLLPVYASGGIPDSEAERVRSLRGWVFAPVVFSELMAGGNGLESGRVNFQLFDQPEPSSQSLVYDSKLPAGDLQSAQSLERAAHSQFSVVRPIWLVDQVFYLRTNSEPGFEAGFHPHDHLKAAALGSGLSVLIAAVLWLLMAGRARAEGLARSMTHDLERLAMVAERTNNAVYFADTAWRITWVNEGFTRMSGFSPEDALGLRPSQLLHSPLADPLTAQKIDDKAERGLRVQIQVLQRNKNGRDYWVDLEVMPVLDPQGQIVSYMSVQSDITQEVQAKAALLLEKERAENILTGTNVGTWELNLLTGEERWNDRWNAMMGFTREDVLAAGAGLEEFWHQRLQPGDQERLNQAMAACMDGLQESYSCDVRVMRKDGSWMWILSRAKVMSRDPNGEPEWVGGIHTDITEIKQVELSLREMESFLDRAGRIASVGAWQIDLQTRAVVFSAQTCAIHGMAPDFAPSEEVALSFYPPADRQRLREAMRHAEASGAPWDLVVEFCNAQGEQRWVRIYGEVGYEDGAPRRLVGAFQDVTQDHWSKLEVERSGALLRGALETINEAFVLFDPEDRLVFCNDKYRAIHARSADLLVYGMPYESVLRGGAQRGQYLDALGREKEWVEERLSAHRTGNVTMEQRLDDGRWLKIIERRMADGHIAGFRIDITELKLATAAAELTSATRGEEQRRMQSILEGTRVGTWEWNAQTGASIYNEQYVAMLGYTLAELEPVGYDTWVRLVHPDDLVSSAILLQEHLRGERPVYETEVRMQHKLGHWIWVLTKGKLAQRLPDGRPLWVYGTHMDITKQKEYETSLREAMQLAEQSSVAKSQFLANMSHEIRTPMNAILGMLQLLRNSALNPHQQDHAEKAVGAARSLLGLLNDILDFSKVEAGKMQLNPEPFGVDHLLADVSVILSADLGQRPVDLLFEVDPQLPRELVGDAMRLKQILINLGGNAVKFTNQGQVTIRWSLAERLADRVKVAVAVVDTGIGIAPENQSRIFDAFTQAEANTTRRFGGTGLGLVISTRLIRLMGGELQLQSALGQGSSFSFTLEFKLAEPGTVPAVTLLAQPRRPGSASLRGMRVLLVEDNLINQQVAQELLSAEGARVTLADNGELGLQALRAADTTDSAFDVVLMDLQMPVMDGLSATRLLRQEPRFAKLPVIAMTANAMRSDREDCLAAGMNDHVGKPFDLQQLVETLILHTGWDAAAMSAEDAAMDVTADATLDSTVARLAEGPAQTPAPAPVELEQALARMGGNQALLQRAITAFVADARRLPQRLRQALQQDDLEQAKRELHGFKGLSATVGAMALSALAAEAEQGVNGLHPLEDRHMVWTRFEEQLAQHLPALEAAAQQLEVEEEVTEANAKDVSAHAVAMVLGEGEREQLRGLLQALQSSNMASLELHAQLRRQTRGVMAVAMEPLNRAMADLDFDAAAVACEKLLQTGANAEPALGSALTP